MKRVATAEICQQKVGNVSPKHRNVGAKDFSPLPHIRRSADADATLRRRVAYLGDSDP
ncbi:MAG: hypothetical protein LBU34_06725 [Planctomycetaceae bacterium]|nr:hypothetical protein [Planctomycetaceae bacterium]